MDRGDPPQPSEHVGDVRAEHAAVHVGLVDDDVFEVREQLPPGVVVRQDPDVEHVGVGDHQVGLAADRAPLLAGGVAVVDRRADEAVQAEPLQRARLVLGERLGRVQEQRPRRRIVRSAPRASGIWKQSDLPEAVPVVTIVGPRSAASIASAWWV